MAGKNATDSPEFEVTGQPKDISGSFDAVYVPEPQEIQIVPGATGAAKGNGGLSAEAQEALFLEEYIEIMVHESTDKNAENPIFTSDNGISQYFYRGQVQRVRRKYVGILAGCKEGAITTPEYTTPDGARAIGIRRTLSLKYPFSVVSDPNPRGAAWLRSLLQAPT